MALNYHVIGADHPPQPVQVYISFTKKKKKGMSNRRHCIRKEARSAFESGISEPDKSITKMVPQVSSKSWTPGQR